MVIVAQQVRALVCGTRGRRFESGLSPRSLSSPRFERDFFWIKLGRYGILFDISKLKILNIMFTLFSNQKRFPIIKHVNIRDVHLYMVKFEESIRNFEDLQKETTGGS